MAVYWGKNSNCSRLFLSEKLMDLKEISHLKGAKLDVYFAVRYTS